MKFGCGFNILPMWHPIRMAEDYAMADIVTDGRVILGVGRGYHTREVETLGGPLLDTDANRAIFEEGLQLMLKCFNEEELPPRGQIFPRAAGAVCIAATTSRKSRWCRGLKHLPVRIYMPIASGRPLDMMAQYGLKAMVTLNGAKILDDVVRAYHAACERHGRPKKLGEDMVWGAGIVSRRQPGRGDPQARGRRMTSASNGSRRSASSATPTKRAAPGAHRARRPRSRPSPRGSSRRRGSAARRVRSSTASSRSRRSTRASKTSWCTGPKGWGRTSSSNSSAGSPAR